MAPSLAFPVTPNPGVTPSKRPRRMIPIIPAIPRSLEKRKLKEDLRSSEDGATDSRTCQTSIQGNEEAQPETQPETAVAQTQAVPNGTFNGFDAKDEVQENGVQEAAFEVTEVAKSEKDSGGEFTFHGTLDKQTEADNSAADGTKLTPVHAQDFGIEKHGFRLPPPFYPKRSPPPALSTDFSSSNEKAIALEETQQTIEGEDGSSMSQKSSAGNHTILNAAAPTFHAHPTPPIDVTTSPVESSSKGYEKAQTAQTEQEPTPPINDIVSPMQLPYQGYEVSQKISFYAQPQSSDDHSSPNHSVYQGYAYAPASYGYSPESHASQQRADSPHLTESGVPHEQRYEPQTQYYSNQSPHHILGSRPPLTPSRTPLDPSAQPWSYANGPPPTIPLSYACVPSYYSQAMFELPVRSASQGTMKSDKSAPNADVVEDGSEPIQYNASERNVANMFGASWRKMDDCMSSHVPLVEHLLQQFNVEEYADCHLTVIHEQLRFERTTWSLSSLLLAQSHKLRDLLKSASLSRDGKISLEIRLTDRFVTPWAMNSALRVLYGERPEMFSLAVTHSAIEPNSATWVFSMDLCLAFAAAGHVLGLESVILKGLQIASSIIDWDNLEQALSFGLESGPNRGTSASVDVIPIFAYSPVFSREGYPSSAFNLTPPPSSTESKPERLKDEGISSVSSHLSEVRSAWDLQMCCLQWMASNLRDSWEFNPSARPLAEVDRLPMTAESRSPLSKSRLSRIQFGEHPSEMHAKASDRNFLVSSIVLSLPFMALKYLLNLGSKPLLRQLHAVVKERERRRQIVLQSKSVSWSQRLAAREHEWAEVGYTEWIETIGDGQITMERTFTGIDRQVSEPSTPSQQKK